MNILKACAALLFVTACAEEYDPPLPIETVGYNFVCTMDQRLGEGGIIAMEPFSFEATIIDEGERAIFQRDGRTFNGRYNGIFSSFNLKGEITQTGYRYRGRDAGGVVLINLPRLSRLGPINYHQLDHKGRKTAFYLGACR